MDRARAVGVCGARVCRAATATCRAGPTPSRVELRPEEVKDFAELYRHNCSGCHGPEGKGGAALALANPVYLAIADDETLRRVTSNGVRGTSMPAFARKAGGTLTDEQIDVLVREIRSRWSQPDALGGVTPPVYRSRSRPANRLAVKRSFRRSAPRATVRTAKADRKGAPSSTDRTSRLVSDQGLRTTVIAGRPDLGQPDWRGYVAGRSLSSQDVSDVVAWLASQRPQYPGQPYPATRVDGPQGPEGETVMEKRPMQEKDRESHQPPSTMSRRGLSETGRRAERAGRRPPRHTARRLSRLGRAQEDDD